MFNLNQTSCGKETLQSQWCPRIFDTLKGSDVIITPPTEGMGFGDGAVVALTHPVELCHLDPAARFEDPSHIVSRPLTPRQRSVLLPLDVPKIRRPP